MAPTGYPIQWLAQQFTVNSGVTITGVQGWIGTQDYGAGGDLLIALYGDSGSGTPGALLDSTTLAVADNVPMGWLGQSGLSWGIGQGNYWIAFEAVGNSSFRGVMNYPADFPLANGAYSQNAGANWTSYGLQTGLRVDGATPVPEPSTVLAGLAALGFTGWIARRRRA